MTRDYQISIRIPEVMHKSLETEAYNTRRTIADIINLMLEDRYPANRPAPPGTQDRAQETERSPEVSRRANHKSSSTTTRHRSTRR